MLIALINSQSVLAGDLSLQNSPVIHMIDFLDAEVTYNKNTLPTLHEPNFVLKIGILVS